MDSLFFPLLVGGDIMFGGVAGEVDEDVSAVDGDGGAINANNAAAPIGIPNT